MIFGNTFYHVADDSVQFIAKFLGFSGMQWTDLVTRILINQTCLQALNLIWILSTFLYHVLSFNLKKPVSDVIRLKVVLWNTKSLSGSERENITFSLLISTAEELCTRDPVNSSKAYYIIPSILTFLHLPE